MEETQVENLPKGTAFTLTVPLDREPDGKKAKFYLREIDEETFLTFKSLVNANKTFDGVRMMIKVLSLQGSDDISLLKNNFIAVNAAGIQITELVMPLEAVLKKN